jgi:hypothetical protein
MAGFDHGHGPRRAAIAVARHCNSTETFGIKLQTIEIKVFRDFGHGTRRLAGGEQNEPAHRRRRQQRRQAARRVRRGYRSAKKVCEKCAQGGIHDPILAAQRGENMHRYHDFKF